MVYVTIYTVDFYDEIDQVHKTESGRLFSTSYTDAMSTLADFYGDTNLGKVELELLMDSPVVTLSKEVLDDIRANYA